MWRQWLPNFFSQRTTANQISSLADKYWNKLVYIASVPLNTLLEKHLQGMVLVDIDPVWHKGIHYISVSLPFKLKDHLAYWKGTHESLYFLMFFREDGGEEREVITAAYHFLKQQKYIKKSNQKPIKILIEQWTWLLIKALVFGHFRDISVISYSFNMLR